MEQALKNQDQDHTGQVVEYGITDAALAELKLKYANTQLTNPKEYKDVVAGIGEVRGLRGKVERHRKALKIDALAWGRKVDAEAKRITAALVEIETPLKALKQADDDRVAAEKAEKERIAQERIDNLKAMIERNFGMSRLEGLFYKTATEIHEVIADIESLAIDEAYQDFQAEAAAERGRVLLDAKAILWRRTKQDEKDKTRAEEDARLAAEREKLEAEKVAATAEQERIQHAQEEEQKKLEAEKTRLDEIEAERQRVINEQQAKIDAERLAIEKARQEEEEARARAAQEEQDRKDRIAREKEEERQRQADEEARVARLKQEEKDRKEREEADRVAREKSDREQLQALMTSAIGAEGFMDSDLETLITIGCGLFLTEDLRDEVQNLALKIDEIMSDAMNQG